MRVEVLLARAPVGHKRVGDIIPDMPEGLARGLIGRGIVKDMSAPVDRMMRPAHLARKAAR
jgi:hypothetical protein